VPECFQNKCVRSNEVLLERAAQTGIPSDMQPAAGNVFRANGASTTNFDSLALCMLRPTQFSIFEKVTSFNEISKLWKSIPRVPFNNWAGHEFKDTAIWATAIWAPATINYIKAGKTPAQAAIMFDDGVRGAYQVAESYRKATGIPLPVVVGNQEGQLRDSKTPMFRCAEDHFPGGFEVGTPFNTSIGAPLSGSERGACSSNPSRPDSGETRSQLNPDRHQNVFNTREVCTCANDLVLCLSVSVLALAFSPCSRECALYEDLSTALRERETVTVQTE